MYNNIESDMTIAEALEAVRDIEIMDMIQAEEIDEWDRIAHESIETPVDEMARYGIYFNGMMEW